MVDVTACQPCPADKYSELIQNFGYFSILLAIEGAAVIAILYTTGLRHGLLSWADLLMETGETF